MGFVPRPKLVFLLASFLVSRSSGADANCERGLFADARKDIVIPMCDESYPDLGSKDSWLILFYRQDENKEVGKYFDVQINKIAKDFGNDPPKGKKDKAKKQRKRLEFLADKFDFTNDLTLPKKGLSDSGPLVKVGAVCCDCAKVPTKCKGRDGLELAFIHAGKEMKLEVNVRKIPETIREVIVKMGYSKPAEKLPEVFGVSENEEEL